MAMTREQVFMKMEEGKKNVNRAGILKKKGKDEASASSRKNNSTEANQWKKIKENEELLAATMMQALKISNSEENKNWKESSINDITKPKNKDNDGKANRKQKSKNKDKTTSESSKGPITAPKQQLKQQQQQVTTTNLPGNKKVKSHSTDELGPVEWWGDDFVIHDKTKGKHPFSEGPVEWWGDDFVTHDKTKGKHPFSEGPVEWWGDDFVIHGKTKGKDSFSEEKCEQREIEWCSSSYRHQRHYGPDDDEKRTCIWSCGDPFSWTEKTSGISWIGVNNGRDAAFVVAMNEKPVPPSGRTQLATTEVLMTALCDMGVWANTSTASTEFRRRMMSQSFPMRVVPFAVVSVAPGTVAEDHPGSSHEASPAIRFLMEKVKGRKSLAYSDIKEIAVCALKYLLGPKFDPNMIKVRGSGLRDGEGPIEDAEFGAVEVQELLAAMNQT